MPTGIGFCYLQPPGSELRLHMKHLTPYHIILFISTLGHREEGSFLRSIGQKLVEENEKIFLAIFPYINPQI